MEETSCAATSATVATYFTFSHTKLFWLILPSPEKRAGGDV
jgi:hypothetical protein